MANDILLDEQGDLLIRNGDLVIGDDSAQVLSLLVASVQGMWEQHPHAGIGLVKYLGAPLTPETIAIAQRDFDLQLKPEGYSESEIKKLVDLIFSDGAI